MLHMSHALTTGKIRTCAVAWEGAKVLPKLIRQLVRHYPLVRVTAVMLCIRQGPGGLRAAHPAGAASCRVNSLRKPKKRQKLWR